MSMHYLAKQTGVKPQVFVGSHRPLVWWKSDAGSNWLAYFEQQPDPSWQFDQIELTVSLKGISHGVTGNYHYIVETDIDEASADEFNAWYDTEHLPGLARVLGTVSAMRYMRLSGSPRFIACYELLSPSVMESKEWLAVRHTAWSSKIRPKFNNTSRELYIRHIE